MCRVATYLRREHPVDAAMIFAYSDKEMIAKYASMSETGSGGSKELTTYVYANHLATLNKFGYGWDVRGGMARPGDIDCDL